MEFVDKFKNKQDNYTEKIKDCKYFEGNRVFKEKKGSLIFVKYFIIIMILNIKH